MNCTKCGQPLDPGAAFCGNCGQPVAATPAPVPASSQPQPAATVPPPNTPPPPAPALASTAVGAAVAPSASPQLYSAANVDRGGGFAVASLVLGILTVPGMIFSILNLPGCILGIIFGTLGLKSSSKGGLAKAGIILSAISLVGSLIVLGLFIGSGK
jgi:hypothetical protein